jgi:hypothetical protein
MTYKGLLEDIIEMALSIINADEYTLPEVYVEQAKMILYTAETVLDKMEADTHDSAAVENTGRTDSRPERVQ